MLLEAHRSGGTQEMLTRLFAYQDILEQYVDRLAIDYEGGDIHPKHRLMRYHEFFTQRIKSRDSVLDVGCGIGIVANSIAKTGADVTGIDIEAEKIQYAKKHYRADNLSFVTGDVTKALPSINFDVIVLSNVLEHIDERVELLKTLASQFSPRKILVRVPMVDRHWSIPLRKEIGMSYFSDDTHYIEYTDMSFRQEVTSAGLTLVHCQVNWGELWAELRCDG